MAYPLLQQDLSRHSWSLLQVPFRNKMFVQLPELDSSEILVVPSRAPVRPNTWMFAKRIKARAEHRMVKLHRKTRLCWLAKMSGKLNEPQDRIFSLSVFEESSSINLSLVLSKELGDATSSDS
jgi:hypothetical protein